MGTNLGLVLQGSWRWSQMPAAAVADAAPLQLLRSGHSSPVLHQILWQLRQLGALLVVHHKHTLLWSHPRLVRVGPRVLLLLLQNVTLQLRHSTAQRLAAVVHL